MPGPYDLFDLIAEILGLRKPIAIVWNQPRCLKMVAAALDKNPNLKIEIDGYTYSTGNAPHNEDLSKRRAEAYAVVLVAQFNVDPTRLTSAGFGAANPISNNDIPDGRLANRRVEFIKK